jgi:hypothetical protein
MYYVVKFRDGAYFLFGNGNETSSSTLTRRNGMKYRTPKERAMSFKDAKRYGGKVYRVTTHAERRAAAAELGGLVSLADSPLARLAIERARVSLRKKSAQR